MGVGKPPFGPPSIDSPSPFVEADVSFGYGIVELPITIPSLSRAIRMPDKVIRASPSLIVGPASTRPPGMMVIV